MTTQTTRPPTIWTNTPRTWLLLGVAAVILGALFWEGLTELFRVWTDPNRQEYSHGLLIPLISLLLVWQLKNRFESEPFRGSMLGIAAVVFGVVLLLLGELSTLYIVVQYGFLITLSGLLWSLFGNRGFIWLLVPLVYLSFMIPLPQFLYQNLSAKLQLISSELGVWVIRAFGISVFLEGNVIDLGVYKLQVVEACSGLRYLFPLASFAFLAAYLYKAPMWKRAFVFVSSIPITILMNSFRIGIIGVLVDNFGIEQAEGFLHFFEGWIIFMACVAILIGEIWLLNMIGPNRQPFRAVFGIDFPDKKPADADTQPRELPMSFKISAAVLVLALVGMTLVSQRPQVLPERASFEDFPMLVDDWRGEPIVMEQHFIDTLNFTDYVMADYVEPGGAHAQMYVAYYEEQRTKGNAAHSPRSCIPGGGWEITRLDQRELALANGESLAINRLQIEKGRNKQLVYYYFKQRDRLLTSEYAVKWYLFWDALVRSRTDGALVRYVTNVDPSVPDWTAADERLTRLAVDTAPLLDAYVPD